MRFDTKLQMNENRKKKTHVADRGVIFRCGYCRQVREYAWREDLLSLRVEGVLNRAPQDEKNKQQPWFSDGLKRQERAQRVAENLAHKLCESFGSVGEVLELMKDPKGDHRQGFAIILPLLAQVFGLFLAWSYSTILALNMEIYNHAVGR